MDVILDRGSTPLTSRKEKGSHGEPFSFLFYKNRSALVQLEKSILLFHKFCFLVCAAIN